MTKVPIDVLLRVIEFIDHPKDLLSLALTARALHALIVPRHIDYRRISCTVFSGRVWQHLLSTPYDACSCIRYLDILKDHGRTKIPRCKSDSGSSSSSSNYHSNDTSGTFVEALSKMVNLKVLRFDASLSKEIFGLISEAIGKAGCDLEELEVHFGMSNTGIGEDFRRNKVSRDLNRFSLFYDYLPSLRKYTIKNPFRSDSGVLWQMLLNAPNLTYINLTSGLSVGRTQGLSYAFLLGYWPNLQHFVFSGHMNCPMKEDYLACLQTFLSRHSKLVTLSTNNMLSPGWAIESNDFLPSLESFYIDLDLHPPTLTTGVAARLVHVKMTIQLYKCLTKSGSSLPNLKTCVFGTANFKDTKSIQTLVEMAPNIQKLYITLSLLNWSGLTDRRSIIYGVMERVLFLVGFKDLRVLVGPFDGISIDSHLPFKALYDFPKLSHIRMRLENDRLLKTFRLERDDVAKVMRHKHEEVIPDPGEPSCWNDLYCL